MHGTVDVVSVVFFFQAEDGIRDGRVTGVQTCALPIYPRAIASTGSAFRRLTTTARFSYSFGSTPRGSTSATGVPVRWFGTSCAVLPNQKLETCVNISPLPGIGSGSTTSNADRRSLATISSRSPDNA